MSYKDPSAVWTVPDGSVKIDPNDPAFSLSTADDAADSSLPAIYLFSNSRDGDGIAYAMAEDGSVLGSHWCSHWGYMRYDLHDRADRKAACEAHYPDGYRLVVLTTPGSLPPDEVIARNRAQSEAAATPDTGAAGVAFLGGVAVSAGVGWLATVYLSLAAVVGFFAACGVSFVLGVLTVATWQADERLYGWDEEPVPYRLVDEVAARRDTHARRTA